MGHAQEVAEAEIEAPVFDTRQDFAEGNVGNGTAGTDTATDLAGQFVGEGHQVSPSRDARDEIALRRYLRRVLNHNRHSQIGCLQGSRGQGGNQKEESKYRHQYTRKGRNSVLIRS